jgi:hypothetical protein
MRIRITESKKEEGGARGWKEPEEGERKGEAVADGWDQHVSDSGTEEGRARVKWADGRGLGSAQKPEAGTGKEEKSGPPLQAEHWAAGECGPKKKIPFSFSFSNFSKPIFKGFSNPS